MIESDDSGFHDVHLLDLLVGLQILVVELFDGLSQFCVDFDEFFEWTFE